jgi:hypothetical protein
MDNSIIFQNGRNKARFHGRLGKSIVEEKEVEELVPFLPNRNDERGWSNHARS